MTTLLEAKAKGTGENRARPRNRTRHSGIDAEKQIDLSKPYEAGLATVLSLPSIHRNGNERKCLTNKFRSLYEAANGRFVSTSLGPIAIAPPVAPWLKDAPLFFASQEDFSGVVAKLRGISQAGLSNRATRRQHKEGRRL
jgi:hypothetical protein